MRRKRKTYTLCYPILLLLLLASCLRDVTLELPPVAPRLVLNASITSGQDVNAHLSKSWFLLDSAPQSEISGGKIAVYVNDQFRGMMQQADIPGDTIYSKGQYQLPGCRVQPGDKVTLKAEATGFEPIAGSTGIPAGVEILSLDTTRFMSNDGENFMGSYIRFYIKFRDTPDKSYYRLIVEKVTESRKGDSVKVTSSYRGSDYDPSHYDYYRLYYEDPVFQSVATNPTMEQLDASFCHGTFTDKLFTDEAYTLKASFSPVETSYKGDSITTLVHYDVRLLAISESYYHYLTVIRNFSVSLGDAFLDGLLEPSATYTNVENGFGVVAGYQIAYRRITMPFGSEDPYDEF